MTTYWINRVFADGTESDYRDSAHFATEPAARKCAAQATAGPASGIAGGECYIIRDGTILAHYQDGAEVEA